MLPLYAADAPVGAGVQPEIQPLRFPNPDHFRQLRVPAAPLRIVSFQKAGAVSLRNHFVNLHRKNQNCHCEPVTDVTGVAIPPTFWMHFGKHSHSTGGFPRQCTHWLGMTVLLFVQLYFNETAPFLRNVFLSASRLPGEAAKSP